jgi:hypothetical protein
VGGGKYDRSIFVYPYNFACLLGQPRGQPSYTPATRVDLEPTIEDAITNPGTQDAEAEIQKTLEDLEDAIKAQNQEIYDDGQAFKDAERTVAESVPQEVWDDLAATDAGDGLDEPAGGAVGVVEVDNFHPLAREQLSNIVEGGVARGAPKPMTDAQMRSALEDAFAHDRAVRESSGGGMTQTQLDESLGEALTANRQALDQAADAVALPQVQDADDSLVQPVVTKTLTQVLDTAWSQLQNLPWLNMVAGVSVTASGSGVMVWPLPGLVGGGSVTIDFTKFQVPLEVCGNFLLSAVFIWWGRYLVERA